MRDTVKIQAVLEGAPAAKLILLRQKAIAADQGARALAAQLDAEMLRVASQLPQSREGRLLPEMTMDEDKMTVVFSFELAAPETTAASPAETQEKPQ